MFAISNPLLARLHTLNLRPPRLFIAEHRRRQTTVDLVNSSPHLLRDIGLSENITIRRGR
jgi:uncharacterized protein YjiS (DUF1127 family)